MTVHWCGTGLSSGPGLRRLIQGGHKVVVWNRTVDKAREASGVRERARKKALGRSRSRAGGAVARGARPLGARAVGRPARIPGMKPPYFFMLSATSVGLNVIDT